MANCLTRICIEENKFEKRKKERQEEEQEEAEKQQLLAFKSKHMRPKRTRPEIQSNPEEPLQKRMKLFLEAGNPPDQDELDVGTWLRKAEERCLRVGNLRTRLEREKIQVLEKMRRMDATVPDGWKAEDAEPTGGPSHQPGEGAPLQQINTRARDHTSQNQDDEPIPKGWKKEEESMDGNLDNFNQQTSNGAELDGVTLGSSNKSSRVPGNRNPDRQDEIPEMKTQKSRNENLVD